MGSQEGSEDVGSSFYPHTCTGWPEWEMGCLLCQNHVPQGTLCSPHHLCIPQVLQHQSRGCPSKSRLVVAEGPRISGQRDMRLVGSGILLWTHGPMSHCPKETWDHGWDLQECAQLWEKGH